MQTESLLGNTEEIYILKIVKTGALIVLNSIIFQLFRSSLDWISSLHRPICAFIWWFYERFVFIVFSLFSAMEIGQTENITETKPQGYKDIVTKSIGMWLQEYV